MREQEKEMNIEQLKETSPSLRWLFQDLLN